MLSTAHEYDHQDKIRKLSGLITDYSTTISIAELSIPFAVFFYFHFLHDNINSNSSKTGFKHSGKITLVVHKVLQ